MLAACTEGIGSAQRAGGFHGKINGMPQVHGATCIPQLKVGVVALGDMMF